MGAPLRDALRRLCAEAGWSYAVFWRAICAQNSTHLVWGDGHCERTRGISGFEAMDLLLKEHGLVRNSCSDSITELLCQTEDRVGALVHKIMMHQVHALGDGIVGQAAVTGDHQWILREGFNDHGSISKGLAEMNEQFLAGIQTIAVIPFLPHGVVQLGSIQMVMEDIGFVKHVRCVFSHLGHVGALLTSVAQSSCSSLEKLHGKTQPTASEVSLIRQTITSTAMPLGHSVQPMNHPILNLNNQLDGGPVAAQVIIPNSGLRPVQQALRYGSISEIEGQSSAMTSAFSSSGLHILEQQLPSISASRSVHPTSFNESKLDVTKTIQLRSGCVFPCPLRDSRGTPLFGKDQSMSNANGIARFSMFQGGATESPSSTHPNLPITGASQLSKHMNHSNSCQVNQNDSHPSNFSSINSSQSMVNMVKHEEKNDLVKFVNSLSTKFDVHGSCYGSLSSSLQDCGLSNNTPKLLHNQDENFSHFLIQSTSENDLFDVVGLDIRKDRCHGTLDNMFPQKDGTITHEFDTEISTSITHLDVGLVFDSVDYDVSGSGIFSEADPDQLLDAVVSNVSSGIKHSPDDSVSCRTSLTKISTSSLHGNTPVYGHVASSRQKQDEFLDLSPILLEKETTASTSVTTEDCSQKTGSKSQINLWVENGQNLKCDSMPAVHCKKVDEIGKLNRKRARPGESPRPRPKDRQMIQDRVKELREIVPDGAKCSIDALLEKTIKHMLFLQSLTKHADKLKETGEPKIISKDGRLLLKDNFEGGVTWAFEVGTQSMICPIIVEDLHPPRQMLVEMLCEEHGFFLEIADLIRGLGLTILKGVMEARKDKIWARFVVEANRDVTRVEIFLSLVHLLEPTSGSSLKLQGIDSIVMPHMFHQSSIPATGSSNYLQ